jgi:hypothetical protein
VRASKKLQKRKTNLAASHKYTGCSFKNHIMTHKLLTLLTALIVLVACNNEPSLQKYIVDRTENPNFITLDLPSSILNIAENKLTDAEKEALKSLKKLNILAFKKSEDNQVSYQSENKIVTNILKDTKYQELMSLGSGKGSLAMYCLGKDEAIEEFILHANDNNIGFAIIRILGNNMNPENLMAFVGALQKSNLDTDALQPLTEILK